MRIHINKRLRLGVSLLAPDYLCLCVSLGLILMFALLRLLGSESIGPNWDNAILIDGSYRVFLGQKPHHDFSTPIGALYFLIGALGMWLSTPTVAGLTLGIVFFGLVLIGASVWYMRAMPKIPLALFVLILGSYLFTARMLHANNPASGGFTGLYNLYGYCILFMASTYLYFLSTQIQGKSNQNSISTAFISILFFLALFIKNSFGVSLALLIFIFFNNRTYVDTYQKIVAKCLILLLILLFWLDFDLASIIRDQQFVLLARLSQGGGFENSILFLQRTWLGNAYICIAIIYSKFLLPDVDWKRLLKTGICFLFLEYFLSLSIMQSPVHILSGFFAFIVIYQLSIVHCKSSSACKKWPLMILSAMLLLNTLYLNMWGSLGNFGQAMKARPIFNIEKSRMAYRQLVNPMLITNFKPGNQIVSVGDNDWYNFYFLTTPPINVPLYWHNTVTFSRKLLEESAYFDPGQIFKDVDLIYTNLAFNNAGTVELFNERYQQYLNKHYTLNFVSETSKIYKRNGPN